MIAGPAKLEPRLWFPVIAAAITSHDFRHHGHVAVDLASIFLCPRALRSAGDGLSGMIQHVRTGGEWTRRLCLVRMPKTIAMLLSERRFPLLLPLDLASIWCRRRFGALLSGPEHRPYAMRPILSAPAKPSAFLASVHAVQ